MFIFVSFQIITYQIIQKGLSYDTNGGIVCLLLGFMLLRVGCRGDPEVLLEDTGEMGLVVEAHGISHLCYIDIAFT